MFQTLTYEKHHKKKYVDPLSLRQAIKVLDDRRKEFGDREENYGFAKAIETIYLVELEIENGKTKVAKRS